MSEGAQIGGRRAEGAHATTHLARCWPTPDDDEGEEAIALHGRQRGVRGAFETLHDAIADLPRVVQVLQEKHHGALQLGNTEFEGGASGAS